MRKLPNDERVCLYRQFIETMIEEGFTEEYIGEQLALIIHALYEAKP